MKTALLLCVSAMTIVWLGQTGCGDTSTIGTGNFGLGAGGTAGGAGASGSGGASGTVSVGGGAGTAGAVSAGGGAGTTGSAGAGGVVAAGGSAGAGGATVYQPCAGKVCGATCTVCDPKDPTCGETAVMKYCSATGSCGMAYPVCSSVDAGTDPCAGKKCGDTCTTCQPGMACAAVIEYCNAAGKCAAPYPVCSDAGSTYRPCAGKVCGDSCTLCAPGDLTCGETMIMKYCDSSSVCTPTPGTCPAPQACTQTTGCIAPAICMLCGNSTSSCASMECVKNQCTWQCP